MAAPASTIASTCPASTSPADHAVRIAANRSVRVTASPMRRCTVRSVTRIAHASSNATSRIGRSYASPRRRTRAAIRAIASSTAAASSRASSACSAAIRRRVSTTADTIASNAAGPVSDSVSVVCPMMLQCETSGGHSALLLSTHISTYIRKSQVLHLDILQ